MSTTLPHRPSTNGSSRDNQQASFASFPASGGSSTNSSHSGQPKLNRQGSQAQRSPGDSWPPSRPRSGETRKRRYKSQYPLDSQERHVEYILVASFHIDRGPIMEHQYPGAISGDEHMLAELMLPDQTHVRSQDW